jgi:hypothetical protein
MNAATSSSAYDSASSRAHPPQEGAALKSIRTGRAESRALASAPSTSFLFQERGIFVLSRAGPSTAPATAYLHI